MSDELIGLDLGTTHVVCARSDGLESRPEVVSLVQYVAPGEVEARPLLPAFLYAPLEQEHLRDRWSDSAWIVGELGRRRGQEVPERMIASAKSWLCHAAVDRLAPILPWGAGDGVPRLSPVAATERLLEQVAAGYRAAFGRDIEKQSLVLTVPASFDQVARELTLTAARRRGLTPRLLEEPQAAFYDYVARVGPPVLRDLVERCGRPVVVLVLDVGGGTTDLTLIRVSIDEAGTLALTRTAVGPHWLLGGDNMDLALAHLCERRLVEPPGRLDAVLFAQLVLGCRRAKERLLGEHAPESDTVTLAQRGSQLVGGLLRAKLERTEVEALVLDGFFPHVERGAPAPAGRAGLQAMGLPYERDPAITRHVGRFLVQHLGTGTPDAVLLNGGIFRSRRVADRVIEVLAAWGGTPPVELAATDPELAVARGAVVYGQALRGRGLRIGGGSSRGFYLGLEDAARGRRVLCVVPRGAQEGEAHSVAPEGLSLVVGQPVRFDLYATDTRLDAPGEVVDVDEAFRRLAPVTASFGASDAHRHDTVPVDVQGELTAIGTLELSLSARGTRDAERFRLAFDLRAVEKPSVQAPASRRPAKLAEALSLVDEAFGKGRSDVSARLAKNLLRELERLLGPRPSWSTEVNRALFDRLARDPKARRRSLDHERVFWMLAGFCLRPGYGYPGDERRVARIAHLHGEALSFKDEARVWQQFWIAWRRIAGGLGEKTQSALMSLVEPFLAPEDGRARKGKKGFRPLAQDEMLAMASTFERVSAARRAALGGWILERTWTDRDPRLWAALGRIGSRIPTYGSAHNVVATRTVEEWLDHLLREKWDQMPTAPRAAAQLARHTGDRARDISEVTRRQVLDRLRGAEADERSIESVERTVELEDRDRAEFFGEGLPSGLRIDASSERESS